MDETVYIGLVVTSHDTTRTAQACISNVRIIGSITPTEPLAASLDIRLSPTPPPDR